ncbi:MAG: hypothetical protein ABI171_16635 [Collimonas sp.]|uniref:hypothetical protein n=1 Tax=Collimonas sp. TaxID=1963772 RepID=UPI003266DBEA
MPISSSGFVLLRAPAQRQRGQALFESILACSILMLFLLGLQWVWRFGELKQLNTEAARFATWERTAYKSTAAADVKTIYSADADLAPSVFRNVYLTPRGARQTEAGGAGASALLQDHSDWMNTAARFFTDTFASATFGGVTGSALSVSTNSAKVPGGPMGFDPTGNALTSLKLDREPYEQVQVSGTIGMSDFVTSFLDRTFGIAPGVTGTTPGNATARTLGSLTMVTNSWSAPGATASQHITKELNPLDASNHVGMILNSNYFNLPGLIGGSSGFGGNFRVDLAGINPAQVSTLISQGMGFNYDSLKNPGSLIKAFKSTDDYKESFNLAGGMTEPDYAGVGCVSDPGRAIRLTQYTQDELCPAGIMRARTISMFDNPAWRFSPAP